MHASFEDQKREMVMYSEPDAVDTMINFTFKMTYGSTIATTYQHRRRQTHACISDDKKYSTKFP